jgi:hypothetical protein
VGGYETLGADQDFAAALGRMTLASARLESDVRVFLTLNGVTVGETVTLGGLVQKLQKSQLLSDNGLGIMRTLTRQRNHLTHKLYDLFACRIGEDLMRRDELEDVGLLADRAWVLENNLNGLAETAEKRIAGLEKGECVPGELLFRP